MTSSITKLFFFFFLCYSLICLTSCVPDEHFILNQDLDYLTSDKEIFQLFHVWKNESEREYQTLGEEAARFQIFKRNLKHIKERNAKRKSSNDYSLGLNEFSDMSYEEFSEIYLHDTKEPTIENNTGQLVSNNVSCPIAPSSMDWRLSGAVTYVKNQGLCGGCWAFSAIAAIEGINQIVSQSLPFLSEQQLISCDKRNSGCEGGWAGDALQYVIDNGGIATDRDYPYTANDSACNSTMEKKKFATIDGYSYWWQTPISDNSLFCAVARHPVSVSIYASKDFFSYKSGIFNGSDCLSVGSCHHNHAVLIVGYGSLGAGQDYWIVKNSWGTSWGLNGYILIKRNTDASQGVCNMNCAGAYPIKGI